MGLRRLLPNQSCLTLPGTKRHTGKQAMFLRLKNKSGHSLSPRNWGVAPRCKVQALDLGKGACGGAVEIDHLQRCRGSIRALRAIPRLDAALFQLLKTQACPAV